jgi:hypothetical protein
MIVTIDTDKMFKLGITPDEYTLLQLIQNHALISAKKLIQKTPTLTSSTLDKLVEKRLIHNSNPKGEMDVCRIMLRNTFIGVIAKDDYFEELLLEYPGKVVRPDGTNDYLKTDLNKCRKLYTQLIKKDEVLHKQIMECLKLEVRERNRTGKIGYMKRLPKWLLSEEWKTWQLQLGENTSIEAIDLGYGLKLE